MSSTYHAHSVNKRVRLLVLAATACLVVCWTDQLSLASAFGFDDGTVQGWTLKGAYDPAGYGIALPSNFTNGWSDFNDSSNPPGSDPTGDNRGAMQLYTPGGHGIDNPAGFWWIMEFHSPDLSADIQWQNAAGYSVRIAESMGTGAATLYANLYVKVYDLDLARDRYFFNGTAVPLTHNQWSYHQHNWSSVAGFPTNYIIREIYISIWGLMADGGLLDGGVYLDTVELITVEGAI